MPGKLVLGTLQHVWSTLETFGLPMAVMGGVALSAWERFRATQDVDILVQVGATTTEELLNTLQGAGFRTKNQPPILEIEGARILQLLYEPPGSFMEVQVDLLFADTDYQEQSLRRRVSHRLEALDREVFVLSCEDLILHKLFAGRILDRADVVALLRANRPTLDLAYLQTLVASLGLADGWSEVWREAFPGEELPGQP